MDLPWTKHTKASECNASGRSNELTLNRSTTGKLIEYAQSDVRVGTVLQTEQLPLVIRKGLPPVICLALCLNGSKAGLRRDRRVSLPE